MLLEGKKGMIFGVANQRSIAWAIAEQAAAHGAKLGFTYQGDKLRKRVQPLAESVDAGLLTECDVTDPASLERVGKEIDEAFGKIDFFVHSIAFANRDCLQGHYYVTPREDFLQAMDISVYSLLALTQLLEPRMNDGGSIVTLTYQGSVKAVPNYNVMGVAKAALESSVRYLANDLGGRGIRVNAISAGPLRTLAAAAIPKFAEMLEENAQRAPLKRNLEHEDVGRSGVYFLSELSSGVTGEIHYVDCGHSIVAM